MRAGILGTLPIVAFCSLSSTAHAGAVVSSFKKETKRASLASSDFHYSAFGLRHISGTMCRMCIQAGSRIKPVKIEAERINTNLSRSKRMGTRKTPEYQP